MMRDSGLVLAGILVLASFAFSASGALAREHASEGGITAFPLNSQTNVFMRDGRQYLEHSIIGWGPGWSYLSIRGEVEADGEVSRAVNRTTVGESDAAVEIMSRTSRTAPQQLTMDLEVASDRDTDLTYLVGSVSLPEWAFGRGRARVTHADDSTSTVDLPLEREGLGEQVRSFTLEDNEGDETTFAFDPPLDVASDGEIRIVLAEELEAQQPVQARFTIDLPATVSYFVHPSQVPQEPGFEDWYQFTPDDDHEVPSEIGMQDWWEAPAGKHGRIEARGKDLYYNGEPIKLWGLNLCFRRGAAPTKEVADRRAALYRKFGVNSVRHHKWVDGPGWAGIQAQNSVVEFDPEGLDLFDYQNAQFRDAGIFIKLSQAFGTIRIGPDDVDIVPYAEEFGSLDEPGSRVGGGNSTLFYSHEIQDLTIKQLQNILNHRNPYTGLTYAEDPAVAFIEIVNESSILFYTSMNPLQQSPTLRRRTAERFSEWLEERYGDHDGLVEAWGQRALEEPVEDIPTPDGEPEHLDRRNILPLGNPWFWDPDRLAGSQAFRRERLLDTLEFLYMLQVEAYERIVEGIRETGYDGEIMGSNWHAGRMHSHYANLHSDYLVGLIDRHNYFGGGDSTSINNRSMSRVPGSGSLSTGMEQVADRPFMLSEWIHVLPNEWGAEGVAIIGAYGLGLQGWDVSYLFQNSDDGRFSNRLQLGGSRWDVTAPQILGLFPAVARQVLRGDVVESETRATRYVHMPSVFEGADLGFDDQRGVVEYDVRTFDSDKVPARALAVARCDVEFTDEFRDTPRFDLAPYIEGDVYVSSTGQLRWREGQERHDGHFTINTPATRAVVGFAQDRTEELGEVTITPQSRFSAIYVTARDRDEDIATGENLVLVAMARARNSDAQIVDDVRILNYGDAPIVMEPVKAEIALDRPGTPTVHVLDHNGRKTGETLEVENGRFTIDGARDQTPYYLISY